MSEALKNNGMIFQPVVGYSLPVVRISVEGGRTLATLSFTRQGTATGHVPQGITKSMIDTSWKAWEGRNG